MAGDVTVLVFDDGTTAVGIESSNVHLNFDGSPVPFVLVFDNEPLPVPAIDPNGADRFNFPVGMTTGPAGDSAFQVAQRDGFTGTEQEWLTSLRGVYVLDTDETVPGWLPVGTVVYRRVS